MLNQGVIMVLYHGYYGRIRLKMQVYLEFSGNYPVKSRCAKIKLQFYPHGPEIRFGLHQNRDYWAFWITILSRYSDAMRSTIISVSFLLFQYLT